MYPMRSRSILEPLHLPQYPEDDELSQLTELTAETRRGFLQARGTPQLRPAIAKSRGACKISSRSV